MNRSRLVSILVGASLALAVPVTLVPTASAAPVQNHVGNAEPSPTTTMQSCYNDVEGGGLPVARSAGISTYAAATSQAFSRSENIWGTSSGCVNLPLGRRVIYSFDVLTNLGSTGRSVWQVVSQLHGPTTNGTWPGPPVTLVIESGQWRIAGGYAVPNGSGGYRTDLGYTTSVATVIPGTWSHWTLDVVLNGPGSGEVTAWLNGTRVLNAYKPRAGTMYTVGGGYSHAYLQVKTGLYTGAGTAADIPSWLRSVQVKNVKFTTTSVP